MTLSSTNREGHCAAEAVMVWYAAISHMMCKVLPQMVVPIIACVALNAFGTPATSAQTAGTPFHANLPPKLSTAFLRGNMADIRRLVSDGKLHALGLALATARLQYNIPKLLTITKACEHKFGSSSSLQTLAKAFHCNATARMSALILGNARTFVQEAQFGHTVLLPRLSKAYGRTLIFGNGLDSVDLSKLASVTPPLAMSWTASKKAIAVGAVDDPGDGWQGLRVHVAIDGTSTPARLGVSSVFPGPLTIVTRSTGLPAVYRKFGLMKVVGPLWSGSNGLSGAAKQPMRVSVALAPQFSFGPLTVRNLAVMVVQSRSTTPGVYLGMSALRWFGGVLIGEHRVVLSKLALSTCRATVPMSFASGPEGYGQLLFPVRVNGRRFRAIWQPEFGALIAMKAEAVNKAIGSASGFSAGNGALSKPAALRVGTVVVHPHAVVTPARWPHDPFQVAIGAGILHQHQLYLQFGGKTPLISICPAVAGR